ncbi:MAG TPA: nucleotidyltransferase domain-containing protein, partial [bacterium]|nr:nucleotidyltransferase domain-containing protein [bacterium]
KEKLDRAVDYLKARGCTRVLFGSFAEGRAHDNSDIDLAIIGLPDSEFYRTVAQLPTLLVREVDLVDLNDVTPYFRKWVETGGVVLYAA